VLLRVPRGDVSLARVVAGCDRLLHDRDPEFAERGPGGERLQRRPQAVDVDQERVARSDAPAHRSDALEVLLQGAGPRVELEPAELGRLRLGGVRHPLRVGLPSDGTVELDPVALTAAEQLVHRHAERLAREIEQRHVDRGLA
jgi:hypothetical protein